MERPNKGLTLASLISGLSRGFGLAPMAAFRDTLREIDRGVSHLNRQGPGRRSILTMHRKIRADAERDTPGAQRMRDVVSLRAANWERGAK